MSTSTAGDTQARVRSAIRTVVVRISRKLKAVYRLHTGPRCSRLLLALVAAAAPLAVKALPQGGTVAAGQSTISTSGNAMLIQQGTGKAILDWQAYNIGQGESVRYVQPGASSVSLNRIGGASASSIYGSLTANGQVFLVNPAGILFAPGASVNVGGLVASTLAISNDDFLAGRYQFSGGGNGSVVNQGSLKGGYVVLAGPQVSNAGTIDATGGSVGLLAGSRVAIDTAGDGTVTFSVDAAAVNAAISNSGTIVAEGGQVLLAAKALSDALPTVINQSGVIRANSIAERNGTIVLSGGSTGVVDVSGQLEARGAGGGETGGTVKVLGDRIGLRDGARVDASGTAGGGTVLVGGNFQGHGPEQNSTVTVVGQGATLDARATARGDGGKVIVWSDGRTVFLGTGDVRGGAQGGNGGFAEVSGKQSLAFLGSVKTQAGAGGQAGTLLLDPENIAVVDDPAQADRNGDGTTGDDLVTATLNATALDGLTSVISNDAVVAQLDAGNVTLNAANNISIDAAIDASGNANANRLRLHSTGAGTIAINQPITLKDGSPGFQAVTDGAGSINVAAAIDSGQGSITLTTAGGNVLLAGDLTATGANVNITGTVRLNGVRTVTAKSATFTGSVDGDGAGGADALEVTGNAAFKDVVGASDALASLEVGGSGKLAGNVTTTGDQTYTGTTTLTGDAVLTSTGAGGNISFGGAVRGTTAGTESLSVVTTATGSALFGGAVGTAAVPLESLTTSGQTTLGGNVITKLGQSYGGNVTLGGSVTATSQDGEAISFSGTVDGTAGTEALTVTTAGDTNFGSSVGSGVALKSLTTNGGGTTLLGGNVTTATKQTYDDAVVLNASVVSASTGNSAIAFNGTVDAATAGAQGLTVDTAGLTTFGATVGATNRLQFLATAGGGTTRLTGDVSTEDDQNYGDNVVLAASLTTASINGGDIGFGGTVKGATGAETLTVNTTGATSFAGAVSALDSLTTDAGGTTRLGGNVTTANAQTYNDNVVLTGNVTAGSSNNANIIFAGTVDGDAAGGQALVVNTTGNTTFASTVGATTALKSVTTNAGGTTFLGGNVTTTGAQTYNDAVVLTSGAVASAGGNVTFASTVDGNSAGGQALTVNAAGTTTFGSTVGAANRLASLTTDAGGSTKLGGNVTTEGAQTYGDNVLLTSSTTAASTSGGAVVFGGTVKGSTGAESLTVNTSGVTSFAGAVSALDSLTTDAGGTTRLGGNVTTANAQTYNDAVVLTGAVVARSTNNAAITFGSTVDGAQALTVTTGGLTRFDGAVGSAGAGLASLTTNGGGTTLLNADVRTSGSQTYADAVVLGGDRVLTGSTVSFGSTVDGVAAGTESLDVVGDARFSGAAGGSMVLESVHVSGTASLGASVTTAGAQVYDGALTLTGNATLASTGNQAITLSGAVNGTNQSEVLTVTTAGATTFGSTVGASKRLGALVVDGGGTTTLNGGVRTAAAAGQRYDDQLTLNGDATLDAGSGAVSFNNVVTGARNLTVTTSGVTTVNGNVTVASLTTNGGGTTDLNADVTTTGVQTYTDNTRLLKDIDLSGSAVSFGGTVEGFAPGQQSLTVTADTTIFGKTVGAATPLEFLGTSGATRLGGDVRTQGTQTYGGDVTVAATSTLTSLGDQAVRFNGRVDGASSGAQSLTVTTAGDTTFNGAVGGATALAGLATNGGGSTRLNGSVTTTGGQTYADTVVLLRDVALTGRSINASNGLTGGNKDLAINVTGTASFSAASGLDDLSFQGGTLAGGTLEARRYNLDGGTVSAALGSGELNVRQGSNTLTGTSAAGTVRVNGGTLTLGPADRLTAVTDVTVAGGATLATGGSSQQLGQDGNLATITNNGTLAVGKEVFAQSINSPGVLRTSGNAHVSTVGATIARNEANSIGDGTRFSVGGELAVSGDFAGAVAVDGSSRNVTLADTSASTLHVTRLQAAADAAVTLSSPARLVIETPRLSPVRRLDVTAPSIQFDHSSAANQSDGSSGLLVSEKATLNIAKEGTLNSEADPLYIHTNTPLVEIRNASFSPLNFWVAGNIAAVPQQLLLNQLSTAAVSAVYAEVARDLRLMLRSDVGLLAVEKPVYFGSLSFDALVAPLSFDQLEIRQPRCLAEQRRGEAGCQ